MMVLEYQDIEVDHCPECKGIWLDAGELRLLLGDGGAAREFLTGGQGINEGEQPRHCPVCRGTMRKETTRGPEPVTYDVCLRGDGLWFDQGELAAIIQHGSSSPGGDAVSNWLRDMFTSVEGN
ncbi:MAG: zf-TFIIB domain-containing protein [Candidatus Hydrogenedentes bacterium]|nr:zf-TFIIB domain-containing protein [Candidatus Hydrogenedentota bacterium]